MVDATRLGAWLRSGEGIGWLAAGIIPNSLYRLPFFYLFLACMCILLLFLSMSFLFCFVLSLELCRCSSDLFLPSRPRTVLATTYITNNCMLLLLLLFLTFSVLVANPKKLLYTVANPARGLLNREKRTKEKVWQHTPPPPPPTLGMVEARSVNNVKKTFFSQNIL